MSRVFVCGLGAVSSAGWGVPELRDVLEKGVALPIQPLERPGWIKPLAARFVPHLNPRPSFLANPRLRRASPITYYAAASAFEALSRLRSITNDSRRLGIVLCLQSGCVQYSCRFFAETLNDPATASPLLFPETVFAAPASHIAALLPNTSFVYTLIGDPASYLQGMTLGVQWLEGNQVDICLIIGSEETNWLLADALWHFEHSAVISGGAGAVCLSLDPGLAMGVELQAITDAHTYTPLKNRWQAARAMREQLPPYAPGRFLCDGLHNSVRADSPELAAWRDWKGPRVSPKLILGEGMMAAAAWQCITACDAVANRRCAQALVSLVGSNQQAIGAQFVSASHGLDRGSDHTGMNGPVS